MVFVLVGFSHISQAASCNSMSGYSLDYGDAPSSYGTACHDTDRWQKLGTDWDTESASSAAILEHDNGTDDGVVWKTSSDNGVTWTAFSSDGEIKQGDIVKFKFTMTRSVDGNHAYDALKVWFDWNDDGTFNERGKEVIKDTKWYKNVDAKGNENSDSNEYNKALEVNNNTDTVDTFTKKITIPDDMIAGDYWLRARVVCSESIENWGNGKLLSSGYLYQGEVEDYQLNIVAKKLEKPTEVPEPSTLMIFALGLIGLGLKRRKAS